MTLPLWRALPFRSIVQVERHLSQRPHHASFPPREKTLSSQKHVSSQRYVSTPGPHKETKSNNSASLADTLEEEGLIDVITELEPNLQQELHADAEQSLESDPVPEEVLNEEYVVNPMQDLYGDESDGEIELTDQATSHYTRESSPIPSNILRAEFTQAQLEHQLRLETDADRLSRFLRGPLQKYRSDRIQRKTWNILNAEAAGPGKIDASKDAPKLRREDHAYNQDAEAHFIGSTATLLRHQLSASKGASELERTIRVGLTDDEANAPTLRESKTAKMVWHLSHPWLHNHMVARFKGRRSRRYESTLMASVLRQIRRTEQPAESRLVWTALYMAANAHALEAVQQHLQALGFHFQAAPSAKHDESETEAYLGSMISERSSAELKTRTTEHTPSNAHLAQLLQALMTGLQEGSAFDGTRNTEGLLAVLHSIEKEFGRSKAFSQVSAFSEWRIMYPYVWMLAECGASDRIRRLWDALWHSQKSRRGLNVWTQLAYFFMHMLFRAGDPTRAWGFFTIVGPGIIEDEKMHKSAASRMYVGGIHPSIWKVLLAHSSRARGLPQMSRELKELCQTAFANEYASQLKVIERRMGISWDPSRRVHDINETRWDRFLDSPPASASTPTRGFPTSSTPTSRVLQPHKWPAADPELADAMIDFRAHDQYVVDSDSASWKDLPRLLPAKAVNHTEWLSLAEMTRAENETRAKLQRRREQEAKAATIRTQRVKARKKAKRKRKAA